MSEGRSAAVHPSVDEVVEFRTSSFSGGGDCVEVGAVPGGGAILRDTKDPLRSSRVVLDARQWRCLLNAVRSGTLE